MTLIARSAAAAAILVTSAAAMLSLSQTAMAEPSAILPTQLPELTAEIPSVTLEDPRTIPETTPETPPPAPTETAAVDATELECMTKVVHREAGNQPRAGMLAVAHVVLNRIRSGRFPSKVCDVANQPGQFFKLATYNPRRDTPMWTKAQDVARAALTGEAEDTSKGAMFFHATYVRPDSFFRTRERLVQLQDHIFYR
ncbi:hypothetical protein GCM10007973_20950 [Polymorphobacter multimanifer]|uniref:Spore germination cell wall hydrolase CwlJ-like protein n=1 Tax=Polymorphobacter multimanifer TaxID=1070431 RepID=A0A841L6D5_9SPHN|nr:cell wall hydrolase [Polymorphobacter multimanifer]MBB6227980.1 spore germination cell wall hydrolase CwlJ-like protein [Polymorphobacter multimanifer]GGI84236.1 hypothetical protein GCM10007973_20950 [Polymorphobacter multimanifer]